MAVVYTLTNPVTVGTLTNPVTVSTLAITAIWFSSTPELAPLGTAELSITVTDVVSGWQQNIDYQDASVLSFFEQAAPAANGQTVQEIMATLVFEKLLADGKIPAGTVSVVSSPTSAQ